MTLISTPLRQRVPMMDAAILEDRTRPAPEAKRVAVGLREYPPLLAVRARMLEARRVAGGGQLPS
jgi:hypothetical protein